MRIFKKKKDFPTKIFVIGSLFGLLILGAFIFLIKINLFSINQFEQRRMVSQEKYSSKDPFITKVLTLKDLIKTPIINDFDPRQGSENGKVAIVYFTDFECGFCYQQEKEIRKVMAEFE